MAERRCVLYVEDDDHNFLLVERTLAATGYIDVIRAADGELGLVAARDEEPDLILMDLNLPGIDGLSTTRQLKADPQTAGIPVLALTANVMPGERERALEAGCSDYIAKPFGLKAFREVVRQYLDDPS